MRQTSNLKYSDQNSVHSRSGKSASKYTDIDNNEKCNQARRNNYTSLGKLAALFVAVPFGVTVRHYADDQTYQRHEKSEHEPHYAYRGQISIRVLLHFAAAVRADIGVVVHLFAAMRTILHIKSPSVKFLSPHYMLR